VNEIGILEKSIRVMRSEVHSYDVWCKESRSTVDETDGIIIITHHTKFGGYRIYEHTNTKQSFGFVVLRLSTNLYKEGQRDRRKGIKEKWLKENQFTLK